MAVPTLNSKSCGQFALWRSGGNTVVYSERWVLNLDIKTINGLSLWELHPERRIPPNRARDRLVSQVQKPWWGATEMIQNDHVLAGMFDHVQWLI